MFVTNTQAINVPGLTVDAMLCNVIDAIKADTTADLSVTLDWGDSTTASSGTLAGSAGSFTVSGTHTFARPGAYAVTVTVTDPATGGTAQSTVNVTADVTQYSVLADILGIVMGPDGNMWFTDQTSNAIWRMTPDGVGTPFDLPSGSAPQEITVGSDGNLWFTEWDRIGRITPAGDITEFAVPTVNSDPLGITVGPDGSIWFTEASANQIGQLTPSGTFNELPIPEANVSPAGIVAGPDGNLWFAEYEAQAIGSVTPSGVFKQYPLSSDTLPDKIIVGPDGNLWFSSETAIGQITTSGAISLFPVDTVSWIITLGPDGNIWFSGGVAKTFSSNNLGEMTTAGATTAMYSAPFQVDAMAAGPNATLWLVGANGQIAVITP
ncbi:MAG: Virginiamycin B lyase [Polyangiaceae bacterium]|nr:Virginiamycin B lyase [Polyangiaceae bacterium]